MDSQTKNQIAGFFHDAIESLETKPLADWFLEDKTDWAALARVGMVSSINDLVIGYVCGYLVGYAARLVLDNKFDKRRAKLLKKILKREPSTTETKSTTKKVHYSYVKVTDKEYAYIKGLLHPLIPRIREIVNKQNASSLLGI